MNDDILIGGAFTIGVALMVASFVASELGASSGVVGWLGVVGFISLFCAILMVRSGQE